MAKSAKKTRRKMAKAAKKTRRDVVARLEGLGLRRQMAEKIGGSANVRGELSGSARTAVKELKAKVDELAGGIARQSDQSEGDAPVTRNDVKAAGKQAKKAARKARRRAVEAASLGTKRAEKKARRAARRADEKTAAKRRVKAAMKAAEKRRGSVVR
ncbi:MAG TPA: hypothetical protein VG165_12205 [Solirubrobacteraceae bacterium]|jgi:hypothetical protein|nr:hypothetical protein [Solirubrobacteraceae bacterium]